MHFLAVPELRLGPRVDTQITSDPTSSLESCQGLEPFSQPQRLIQRQRQLRESSRTPSPHLTMRPSGPGSESLLTVRTRGVLTEKGSVTSSQ